MTFLFFRLLVGAPKDNITDARFPKLHSLNKPGQLWRCPVTSFTEDCEPVTVMDTGKNTYRYIIQVRTGDSYRYITRPQFMNWDQIRTFYILRVLIWLMLIQSIRLIFKSTNLMRQTYRANSSCLIVRTPSNPAAGAPCLPVAWLSSCMGFHQILAELMTWADRQPALSW